MCVPDLSILRSAVLGDQSYHMGAIVARRLHHNRFNGDFFGGIYATRLANFLDVDICEGDMELPSSYLDLDSMFSHQFIERTGPPYQYRLIFNKWHVVRVALPAPTFFDFQARGRYIITREEADEYERGVEAARLHAAAQEAITVVSQYGPSYTYGYPPGHPWQ